jgi:ankyrin repeat protein
MYAATMNGSLLGLMYHTRDGKLDKKNSSSRAPSLVHAAEMGFVPIVQFLIDYGANVNLKDAGGFTALHWAAGFDQYDCARLLLESGARPDVLDAESQTAFDIAWKKNYFDVGQILCDYGGGPSGLQGYTLNSYGQIWTEPRTLVFQLESTSTALGIGWVSSPSLVEMRKLGDRDYPTVCLCLGTLL